MVISEPVEIVLGFRTLFICNEKMWLNLNVFTVTVTRNFDRLFLLYFLGEVFAESSVICLS